MKKKTIKLIINITPQHKKMVEDLMEKKCAISSSEIIRWSISEAYRKEFPDYIQIQKARIESKDTVEEKAIKQNALEELRKKDKKDKSVNAKAQICELLGGETEMINDQPHCKYFMHTEVPGGTIDSIAMTEPYDTLTENSVNIQYRDLMGKTGAEIAQKLKFKLDI